MGWLFVIVIKGRAICSPLFEFIPSRIFKNKRYMKANLNGQEFIVKFSYRTFFEYEEGFGKRLSTTKTQRDIVELFYCTLKVNNQEFPLQYPSFDAFLDALEDDSHNTVEEVCTAHYMLYLEGLKKKMQQNQPQK